MTGAAAARRDPPLRFRGNATARALGRVQGPQCNDIAVETCLCLCHPRESPRLPRECCDGERCGNSLVANIARGALPSWYGYAVRSVTSAIRRGPSLLTALMETTVETEAKWIPAASLAARASSFTDRRAASVGAAGPSGNATTAASRAWGAVPVEHESALHGGPTERTASCSDYGEAKGTPGRARVNRS